MQHDDEPAAVRAQCAEALAGFLESGLRSRGRLGADPRNKRHRRIIRGLIAGLRDPLPQIRFWCAFALGKSRYRRAIGPLRHLAATDNAICPGWWAVADEARDAIAIIQGRQPPSRQHNAERRAAKIQEL